MRYKISICLLDSAECAGLRSHSFIHSMVNRSFDRLGVDNFNIGVVTEEFSSALQCIISLAGLDCDDRLS